MAMPPSSHKPFLCVVDFNHARGPEVERWIGISDEAAAAAERDWPLLSFMALCDGAHALKKEFSYFTLPYPHPEDEDAEDADPRSLFGIACTRQVDSRKLLNKPDSVTRSTVQKSVVIVCEVPEFFPQIKEKLSIVCGAWFNQLDFSNIDILVQFQASLAEQINNIDPAQSLYFGLSFREFVYRFRHQALVLFKACLLQKRILFFGNMCEKVCQIQFALVSLIPGLIRNLRDCADPDYDHLTKMARPSTSLQYSDKSSLLAYMGFPLQIFGKGSFFGPYIPLQQLDMLLDERTKSCMVGSTNSLLLQQKEKYCDIFVNMDDYTIQMLPNLKSALALTVADRRWIDNLTKGVLDTWDEASPSRPTTLKYEFGEDYIRVEFEKYLMAMAASAKYHLILQEPELKERNLFPGIGNKDTFLDYGIDWTAEWKKTENFQLFCRITDPDIFNVIAPMHPCAGQLTFSDIQRRMNHHLYELHWGENFQGPPEFFSQGKQKISAAIGRILADFDDHRRRSEESPRSSEATLSPSGLDGEDSYEGEKDVGVSRSNTVPAFTGPNLTQAQASVKAASARAGAYFSSWGSWASNKRAEWGRSSTEQSRDTSPTKAGMSNEEKIAKMRATCIGHRTKKDAGSSEDETIEVHGFQWIKDEMVKKDVEVAESQEPPSAPKLESEGVKTTKVGES